MVSCFVSYIADVVLNEKTDWITTKRSPSEKYVKFKNRLILRDTGTCHFKVNAKTTRFKQYQ